MTPSRLSLLGIVALLADAYADANSVVLRPSADANLFEHRPEQLLGSSEQLQIGLNNAGNRGRGIYRFDLAGSGLPAGSIVTSVEVELHVTGAGGGATPTPHELFRVQLPWGEDGTSWCASDVGTYWTIPGGNAGTDYHDTASAVATLDGNGTYVFGTTPGLVTDVQRWLDGTAPNYGWLLVSANETAAGNSRRIGAREAGVTAPALRIGFTPFQVTGVSREEGGRMGLEWTGGTPPFGLETSDDGIEWQAVAGEVVEGRRANLADRFGGGLVRVRDRLASPSPGARYRVDLVATWSAETHPMDFPVAAHLSPLIGTTHNGEVSFWEPGGFATLGIERMAERGTTSAIIAEFRDAELAGHADERLMGSGTGSPGGATIEFEVARSHPLVTLVAMIAPSPDWFVGVSGLDLFEGGCWVDRLSVALHPYDAGTDSGEAYTSPDADSDPAEPITRITGSPLSDGDKARPIGVFTFTRVE